MSDFEVRNLKDVPADEAQKNLGDDILVDVIDTSQQVLFMNNEQALVLGLDKEYIKGLDINIIYTPESANKLKSLLRKEPPEGFQTTLELSLVGRGGRVIKTIARCCGLSYQGSSIYRFVKIPLGSYGNEIDDLKIDNEILRKIVENASEGHWCIEFLEPVDLSQSHENIVDQIFDNASIWRVTNQAMSRLYQLPSGENIRAEDVRLYWPRSNANEEFVEQIVESNFCINSAVAVDRQHDGTPIYVENDVQADIEDGLLLRIWGNCRDVTSTHKDHSEE